MGARVNFGALATGGGWSNKPGALQPSFEESRGDCRPNYNYQRRSAMTWKDRNGWTSLWPSSRFAGGDLGGGYNPIGQGVGDTGMYEPFSCDGEGTQTKRFIRGTCVDASEVPVANATVQAFRTSDDFYAGEGVSLDDGTYYVGVEQALGVAHYLVAYKPGSPDIAGTTVNTLTPTNVDGS